MASVILSDFHTQGLAPEWGSRKTKRSLMPPSGARVSNIYDTIRRHCPESDCLSLERIARFCRVADLASEKLKGRTVKISQEIEGLRNRPILIGPDGKFLLLTGTKKGGDRPVGNGSFRRVGFCVDLDTGDVDAVGIVKKKNLKDPSYWDDVRRLSATEGPLMKKCGDIPEVLRLKLHHHYSKRDEFYQVTDYHPKGLLSRLKDIDKRKAPAFTENEKYWLMLEISKGLAQIHAKGILHRDIKLDNILLTHDGHAKIADFGFACPIEQGGLMKHVGTPNYEAPEIIAGGSASVKTDAWSLGCTLVAILTSRMLFNVRESAKSTRQAYVESFCQRHLPKESSYIPLLENLLCYDTERRWTAQQFYGELLALGEPEKEKAKPI